MYASIGTFEISSDESANVFDIKGDICYASKVSVNCARYCTATDVMYVSVLSPDARRANKVMHCAYVNHCNEVKTETAHEYASFHNSKLSVGTYEFSREVSQEPQLGGFYNATAYENMTLDADMEDEQVELGKVKFTWDKRSQTLLVWGNR